MIKFMAETKIESELGKRLREIRKEVIASGVP
jgi:hypothetical protein